MLVSGSRARKKDKVLITMLAGANMQVAGQETRKMVMEFKLGLMETDTKDNGKINDMERVHISTQMEQEEKQNMRMEHDSDGLLPEKKRHSDDIFNG